MFPAYNFFETFAAFCPMVPDQRRVVNPTYVYKMTNESLILDEKSAFNMCQEIPGGKLPILISPEDAIDLAYAVRNQLGN